MTITVWQKGDGIRLHQIPDDPADGTPEEQIAHLATLDPYQGFACVATDYRGTVPEGDPSLWRWDGQGVVAVVPVPESITPRQCRLILLSQNLLDQVETMIKTQDRAVQLAWEYASEFRRDDPLLDQLAKGLGLTDAQLDQFFIAAAGI